MNSMLVLQKLKGMLCSRKFWVLLAALIATWSGFALGEISVWQSLQMTVAALAVYSTGVAIEDAGIHISGGQA